MINTNEKGKKRNMLRVDAEHERSIPLLNLIRISGLAFLNNPPFYIAIKQVLPPDRFSRLRGASADAG